MHDTIGVINNPFLMIKGLSMAMLILTKLQLGAAKKPDGYQQALDDVAAELRTVYEAKRDHQSLTPTS
jgi:hypothetical protein